MTDPRAHITRYAESTRGLINQASEILVQANDQISDGTFGSGEWAKSARKLFNLALTTGLECDPMTLLSGCLPAQLCAGPSFSDYQMAERDNECQRTLSVAKSFVHVAAPSCVIPDKLIVFDPPILPVYATRFRVGADGPDLRCGTYRGVVRLTRIQTAGTSASEMDVTVDL